jgi:hypothetical protein
MSIYTQENDDAKYIAHDQVTKGAATSTERLTYSIETAADSVFKGMA